MDEMYSDNIQRKFLREGSKPVVSSRLVSEEGSTKGDNDHVYVCVNGETDVKSAGS